MLSIDWNLSSLVFLDEMGFDNRDMLRKKGNSRKGTRLVYRGEFDRKPRVSLLCFAGLDGLVETYQTEGTFDRAKFIQYARSFALSTHVR